MPDVSSGQVCGHYGVLPLLQTAVHDVIQNLGHKPGGHLAAQIIKDKQVADEASANMRLGLYPLFSPSVKLLRFKGTEYTSRRIVYHGISLLGYPPGNTGG